MLQATRHPKEVLLEMLSDCKEKDLKPALDYMLALVNFASCTSKEFYAQWKQIKLKNQLKRHIYSTIHKTYMTFQENQIPRNFLENLKSLSP